MKTTFFYLFLAALFVGCQPAPDNSVSETFDANSKTVLANLEGFESENLDYSMYAADFVMLETVFGSKKDSLTLKEVMASDKLMWKQFNFKILTKPTALLPGVNADTAMPDGSVRHYSDWEVTLPATDSTESRSGIIKLYESYDFNAEGKIIYQQVYGDFSGLMLHLSIGGD